ncbi:MAG: tol-pal system-associated acyl-CoA thioesterase [Burkholderiales bacterium]
MSGAGAPAAVFTWPVRVYYEDTDAGGVVYYANYLRFLERARTEWLRAAGFEQPQLLRDFDVIFVVRALTIEYLRPAHFNDLLSVTVSPLHLGRSVLDLAQTIERDALLVTARVKIACVQASTFRPTGIPAVLRNRLESLS